MSICNRHCLPDIFLNSCLLTIVGDWLDYNLVL